MFRNVARVRNSCKLHGFLSVFGFLCIEMLHVYQSVELFMRLRRFFSFLIIINNVFFFFVTLLYWNEDSTIKKEYKRIPKYTYKLYKIKIFFS